MYMALDANVLPYYMDPISFLLLTFEPKKTQINCLFIRSPERLNLHFKTIVNLSSSSSSPNPASPWVHPVLLLVLKHAQQWAFLQHVGVGRTWLPLGLKPKTTYTAVSTDAKSPSRYLWLSQFQKFHSIHNTYRVVIPYKCQRQSEHHLFKWIDEAIIDEISMVDKKISQLQADFQSFKRTTT